MASLPWTEEHVAAYEARWPIGTRQRVWLDVLAYTGLRRGDAVRLGRQHVRDGVATIKTEKSKFMVEVSLPILPVLAETLTAGHVAIWPSSVANAANLSPRKASAICSRTPVRPLACQDQRTASARSRRLVRPTMARRKRS